MSSLKFDQMFKFISQYKFEISENVPDNFKCGKCQNILINAHCVPCGCSYCCDCVNEMLNNGMENCPGKTEDCKNELISNNQVEYKTNKAISNVVIKCPEEMCAFECTIINMEEHVRVCEKKSVKCPLANLGCDGKKMAREMLNDHCQSANFNHCKILIDMIDNMRNEIDILKANDERNQLKIENLEKNLKSKDEIIDKINEKIHLIKLEKETVKQEFDLFKQNLGRKIEEMDDKIKRENDKMKIDKNYHDREYDKIKENSERKTKEIFTEIEMEKQERIKSINDETKLINAIAMETKNKSEMMETRINKLNKIIEEITFTGIEWTIDRLDKRRKEGGSILSEYFISIIKQYNFRLLFCADGNDDIRGKGCSICLLIYSGANDQFLCWPFTGDVTIKMISKTNPNIKKSLTKSCKIDRPPNNCCKTSELFNYLYCDLTKEEKILDNSFIVECFIDFK